MLGLSEMGHMESRNGVAEDASVRVLCDLSLCVILTDLVVYCLVCICPLLQGRRQGVTCHNLVPARLLHVNRAVVADTNSFPLAI